MASQKLRRHALFGPFADPTVELSPSHYCILERIGRSRRMGEPNVQMFCKDAQQAFYVKKTLMKNGLIRRQLTDSSRGTSGAVALSRFYNESKVSDGHRSSRLTLKRLQQIIQPK